MITISEQNNKGIFASNVFFERTEQIRSSIQECTCEELLDLCKYLHQKMEESYGAVENASDILARNLGWKQFV